MHTSQGGFFGGVEGAQPETGTVLLETDLCDPFSPMSLPDPYVELGRFRRGPCMLHWDGFGTEETEGTLMFEQLAVVGDCGKFRFDLLGILYHQGKWTSMVVCFILGLGYLVAWNSLLTIGDYYSVKFPVQKEYSENNSQRANKACNHLDLLDIWWSAESC